MRQYSILRYSNTPFSMKFTLNWLKEFVDVKPAPEELAEMLTMAGLEVESVTPAKGAGDEPRRLAF